MSENLRQKMKMIRQQLSELRKIPVPSRSDDHSRKILDLETALLKQKQAVLSLKASAQRSADEKTRKAKLSRIGFLAEVAGIENLDEATLLGAFTAVSQTIKNNSNYVTDWKKAGVEKLASLETVAPIRRPLVVKFPELMAKEVRLGLRSMKLSWSEVRGEWSGFADPAAVRELVKSSGGIVTEIEKAAG